MAPTPKARNWCFTINNPGTEDAASIDKMAENVKYLIVGNEKGENGVHHFQGFLMTQNQVRLSTMKDYNGRAHWEIAKGTAIQAAEYCKKDGDFKEWGTVPASQKRKGEAGAEAERERWKRIRQLAKDDDEETLEDEFPRELTLYEGPLKRLAMRFGPCKDLPMNTKVGVWLYGTPGSGKSFWAMNKILPREKIYRLDVNGKNEKTWWDGYDESRHEGVVIEDFSKFMISKARDLKIWVQEYAFNAQIKGGFFNIRPKLVIITSNYRISDIWDDQMTRLALRRRFKRLNKPCLKHMDWCPDEEEDPTGEHLPCKEAEPIQDTYEF